MRMGADALLVIGSLGFLLFLAMLICVIGICQCSNTKDDFVPEGWEENDEKTE